MKILTSPSFVAVHPSQSAGGCPAMRKRTGSAIALVEAIIYIGVLSIVSALAFGVFYSCWDQTKQLSRNAADIVQMLRAGEQWREDIRNASGPIECEEGAGSVRLCIHRPEGAVVFLFEGGEVWRYSTNGAGQRETLLMKAKSCGFICETNHHVRSWRWELEVAPHRKNARVHPLMTFMAVPGTAAAMVKNEDTPIQQ